MKQACLLAIAFAGCPTAALAQGTFDYTYVEAVYSGYKSSELEGRGVQGSFALGERWFLLGSYDWRSGIGYGDASTFGRFAREAEFYDYEDNYARIGLGFHAPINPRMDFVSRVMLDHIDGAVRYQYWLDTDLHLWGANGSVSYRYDERTFIGAIEAGVRGLPHDRWELWGMAGYSHQGRTDISNVREIFCSEAGNACVAWDTNLEERFERRSQSDGSAYARLGTVVHLTDRWGLVAQGRFGRGGAVSYYAGVRLSL